MAVRAVALLAAVDAIRVNRGGNRDWATQYKQKTVSGCECFSECTPNRWDKFECDTCDTKGCGKQGLRGRWDFCSYPIVESFESQSADQKFSWFWEKVLSDPTPNEFLPPLAVLADFLRGSSHGTFDIFTPQQPEGRGKVIHSVGSVAQIKMTITDSPFTGLLADGVYKGFIRIGGAQGFPDKSGGMTPGLGFKFPRDGIPSGDFVAMHNTDSGHSTNFFSVNMSNHINAPSEPGPKLLAKKFHQATACASKVGLSDFAKYTQSGKDVGKPKFPFKLFFIPSKEVQLSNTPPKDPLTLASEMAKTFKPGTPLFTVYGCSTPSANPAKDAEGAKTLDNCGGAIKLGKMEFTTSPTLSGWGDQYMHFRHQRIEDDWKLEPSFEAGSKEVCGKTDKEWTLFKKEGGPKPCVGCMRNSDALFEAMDGKGGKGGKKSKGKGGGISKKSGKSGASVYAC